MNENRTIPALSHWKQSCASAQASHRADKSILYRQGHICHSLFIIIKGHVKLCHTSLEGIDHTIAILSAGEICGIPFDVNENSEISHTAITKGDTTLFELQTACISSLFKDAALAEFIILSTAKRQQFYEHRLECLLNRSVRKRLVATLIELCSRYGGYCSHGHEIDMRMTHQELAEMIGASRPVVSACINQLRQEGHINYTRDFICIENLDQFRCLID